MKPTLALALLTLICACSPTVQTTSGAAFLAARNTPVDADIAAAAAVEPDLQFPARIGIGRISSYKVEQISAAEQEAMQQIAPNAARLGTFIPIDTFHTGSRSRDGIHAARLAAAKQHLDYVLLYDLQQEGRGFGAKGRADVVFVDVRNGYVYGRTTVSADLDGLGHDRRGWGDFAPSDAGGAKLITTAAPDVAEMLTTLVNRS